MLSPKARNLVNAILGGAVTVIGKVHDAARRRASVAVHVTVVVPTGNVVALAGVQLTVAGGAPDDAVAWP
jgi:hypothetical protein